jgi:hypothetical protein
MLSISLFYDGLNIPNLGVVLVENNMNDSQIVTFYNRKMLMVLQFLL